MLSKAQIKYIRSLTRKKLRHIHGIYIIEGEKIIREFLTNNIELENIYATKNWIKQHAALLKKKKINHELVSDRELEQISNLKTPHSALGLAKIPSSNDAPLTIKGVYLALDNISDPGNMGTIIRTADWFGVTSIYCTTDCVDVYNPKVVQATMGSIAHIPVYYTDLEVLLKDQNLPVYAATLNGKNIYKETLPTDAVIIIGNESKGLSDNLVSLATKEVAIPQFGKGDSLNAAMAAGIILSQFKGN